MIRELLQSGFGGCKPSLCKTLAVTVLFVSVASPLLAQQDQPRKPLQANLEDGAEYRWLNKKVIDSRLLDGMGDLASWSFKGEADMALSTDYTKEGQHSLKIQST